MMQAKLRRKVFRVLAAVGIIYLSVALAVFFFQRNLLYFPDIAPLPVAVEVAKRAGFEPWNNPAGEFMGWKKVSATNSPRNRILITHGNAGSAIDRADYASYINQTESCDVYLLEYPGYGPRAGSPTQQSLFHVADEAMGLLEKEGSVYLIGESLGTGVAAYLAGAHPTNVAALLLIAPYHNLGDVAQSHMPIFPARYMLLDKFPSAEYLRNYHGRLAILLAGQDEVVPNRFGKKLFEGYGGPKKVWEIPRAGHNDLPNVPAAWWKELLAFWKS